MGTQHHTSYIRRHVNLISLSAIMLVKRNEEKRGLLDPENQEEDSEFSMVKESLLNEPQDPAKNSVGVVYAGLVITLIFTIVGFSSYALEQHGIAQIQELDRLD